MNQNKKATMLMVFLTLLLFGVTMVSTNRIFFLNNLLYGSTNAEGDEKPDPDEDNYYKFFYMFQEAYTTLKKEFYDKKKVTAKQMFYGAIQGMAGNTKDPYTVFMDPNITKEFDMEISASFSGIGIQIDVRDGWLTVVSPIEGTPGWRAGLKPNDKIVEIEGKSTKGITTKQAVNKLRGERGSKVTISIARSGIDKPFPVSIVRDRIKLKTVKSDIIPFKNKKVGYVKVSGFSIPTANEFRDHLNKLKKKKLDGLIIDLRYNPGGSLSVVIDMVDDFIERGLIVYTRGRQPQNNADQYASRRRTIISTDMPLVVLINQGSASASEIFAGAIKDTGRGVLVGMKSFGKGSVQKTYRFRDDKSMLKYTVARYYTPAGTVIDQKGLQPDVEEKIWYEKLSDDEKKGMIKIQQTNYVKLFLKKVPNPNENDLLTFRKEMQDKDYEVSLHSIKWMVKNEKNRNKMPSLFDLKFDNQLTKALDVVKNYRKYRKKVKYYDKAKEPK